MRLIALIALFLSVSGCSCSKVPAGHVGVKVYLLGGSKGVDHEVLGVGRYFIGINEDLYLFPTFSQNYVWTASPHEGSRNDESITFQTKEGLTVNTNVGITYSLEADKIALIFAKYRRGIEEITDTFLRNQVRDAMNSVGSDLSVQDVYGVGKVKMMEQVQKLVSEQVGPIGIKIEKIYLVDQMRLPPTVTAALNSKIEATQRAQQRENELREAEAEARKNVAKAEGEASQKKAIAEGNASALLTEAESQSKANRLLSESLTPALIEYRKLDKWNGVLPQFTGGGNTMVQIPVK